MGKAMQLDEHTLRWVVAAWLGGASAIKRHADPAVTVAGERVSVRCLQTRVAGGPDPRDATAGWFRFKVEDERSLKLTERPGFVPAPNLARTHWMRVAGPGRLVPSELAGFLRSSCALVRAKLPKKTQLAPGR